jgi:ubiquitin C-terminal hydrolase
MTFTKPNFEELEEDVDKAFNVRSEEGEGRGGLLSSVMSYIRGPTSKKESTETVMSEDKTTDKTITESMSLETTTPKIPTIEVVVPKTNTFTLTDATDINNAETGQFPRLTNCGNSCYFNAILQVLSHTQEFVNLLNTDINASSIEAYKNLAENIKNLITQMGSKENIKINTMDTYAGIISIIEYIKTQIERAKNPIEYGKQSLASEFLYILLSGIKEALNPTLTDNTVYETLINLSKIDDSLHKDAAHDKRLKQASEFFIPFTKIQKTFSLCQCNQVTDASGNYLRTEYEPNYALFVPRNNKNKLLECLREYITPRVAANITNYYSLFATSDIFIIHLIKEQDKYGNLIRSEESDFEFDVPEELDLSSYFNDTSPCKEECIKNYTLYAVTTHIGGSAAGGHYVSSIKINGEWYNFDDTVITKLESVTDKTIQKGELFFYRRTSPETFISTNNPKKGDEHDTLLSGLFSSSLSSY